MGIGVEKNKKLKKKSYKAYKSLVIGSAMLFESCQFLPSMDF